MFSTEYPVSSMGNHENPKLVILTFNPHFGADETIESLPEAQLDKMGKYDIRGMNLREFAAVCPWWQDILNLIGHKVKPEEILTLEYLPYRSSGSAEVPKQYRNDELATLHRKKNIVLIRRAMANGAKIFGYYHGDWVNELPELKRYPHFGCSSLQWKNGKRKALVDFVNSEF
ncbi:MAG: hypothetical protein K2M34_04165 [Alphaproteobacteria bacterium]|nr:hypothetical protein [Alphaproteobacteria bacterium]